MKGVKEGGGEVRLKGTMTMIYSFVHRGSVRLFFLLISLISVCLYVRWTRFSLVRGPPIFLSPIFLSTLLSILIFFFSHSLSLICSIINLFASLLPLPFAREAGEGKYRR